MNQKLSFLNVQYCSIEFEEAPYYNQDESETDTCVSSPQPMIYSFARANSCKPLEPLFQQIYNPMEIETQEEIIEQLIINQPRPLLDHQQIGGYFKKIYGKLTRQHMLDRDLRNKYMDIFEKDSIQRKQCSSLDMLLNLYKSSYKEFMNTQITDIGIIKIFIEDNIDAFITGSLFPPQQLWHDYKIVVFALIIKIMRVRSIIGQLIYESLVAYLYCKLTCIFENEAPPIPEYKDYFDYYFWADRDKQMEVPDLTESDKRSIRMVSIIRKLSCLLWSLVWIDPNQVLNIHPQTEQFRRDEKIPAYRFLNRDRQLFSLLISKFVNCNTFAFLPALNSLYDVVQDKTILLPIFQKFQNQIQDIEHLKSLLNPLGPFKEEATKEFFQNLQVIDEGLIGIVKGKWEILNGNTECKTENDFYQKLFQNDQRSTFYSD